MSRIVVDELQGAGAYPTKGQAARVFGAGKQFCHLMVEADEHGQLDLEALHKFADLIGLKRSWFQPRSSPHYDLTPSKRALALRVGAAFVPAREQAVARVAARALVAPARRAAP